MCLNGVWHACTLLKSPLCLCVHRELNTSNNGCTLRRWTHSLTKRGSEVELVERAERGPYMVESSPALCLHNAGHGINDSLVWISLTVRLHPNLKGTGECGRGCHGVRHKAMYAEPDLNAIRGACNGGGDSPSNHGSDNITQHRVLWDSCPRDGQQLQVVVNP